MDMVAFAQWLSLLAYWMQGANATSGFYNKRDRGNQSYCLCYWTAGDVVGYTTEFDEHASLCQEYLTSVGSYSAVASAMGGSSFIGTSFCDPGIKETKGLLSPGEWVSDETQGGTAPLLTPSDKRILVS